MRAILIALLSALIAAPGFSEEPAPVARMAPGPSAVVAATGQPAEFTLGAGDLLEISVAGVEDFTLPARVGADGTIRLPFLGNVRAEGLTPGQLEEKLADLLDPDYVRDPQVLVVLKEPLSRMYSVLGAVKKPGQFEIIGPVTLVSAIAAAGGLDYASAGTTAVIQRSYGLAPGARPYSIEVDLKKLMAEGNVTLDLPVMPGDVIGVPQREAQAVYVIGDVGKPGAFEWPLEGEISLSRALAMAGGPTKTAKMKEAWLVRQAPDGSVERTAVNLGDILKGKKPDIALRPEDMIYVSGSTAKSIGWGFVNQAPNIFTWGLLR